MLKQMSKFFADENGATVIEYAMVGGLMAAAIIASLGVMNADFKSALGSLGSTLKEKGVATATK